MQQLRLKSGKKLNKLFYFNKLNSSFNSSIDFERVAINCEDLWYQCWYVSDAVSAMDLSGIFSVNKKELSTSWQMFEAHVIEDDSFVKSSFEFSESINVGDPKSWFGD